MKNAESQVLYHLVDPDTAKFRNMVVRPDNKTSEHGPAVCGEVNAKNRMGGYDGYERFVAAWAATADEKKPVIMENGFMHGEFFEGEWNDVCGVDPG